MTRSRTSSSSKPNSTWKAYLPFMLQTNRLSMTYCELWLQSEGGVSSFRVALLAPDEFEVPDGFTFCESQIDPDKKFYVSDVLEGIIAAKKAIDCAAQFYSERDLKFLYYREIRKSIND